MVKKPTVTIGIPAYNEEKNITSILSDLKEQKLSAGINLAKVVVLSDASCDKTFEMAKRFDWDLLEVKANRIRKGKFANVVCLFNYAKKHRSDIFVSIDADLRLDTPSSLNKLISGLLLKKAAIASGNTMPNNPNTRVEKIAYFGTKVWNNIFLSSKKPLNYYKATDQYIAFNLKLIQNITSINAEYAFDHYYFLICQKQNRKFELIQTAKATYHLPKSFSDYRKQMRRFLLSDRKTAKDFGNDFLKEYRLVTPKDKILSATSLLLEEPINALGYIFIQILLKIEVTLFCKTTVVMWDSVKTTKFK